MKRTYEFKGHHGLDNCHVCDELDWCSEFTRNDGLVCAICEKCEPKIEVVR